MEPMGVVVGSNLPGERKNLLGLVKLQNGNAPQPAIRQCGWKRSVSLSRLLNLEQQGRQALHY